MLFVTVGPTETAYVPVSLRHYTTTSGGALLFAPVPFRG
jgi:hypothetical protein